MDTRQVQCLLAYLGYETGGADGVLGAKTTASVLSFQQEYGLTADGIPGPETQAALRKAVWTGWSRPSSTAFWAEIRHFKRAEFACKCGRCGGFPAEPEEDLLRLADTVREMFGQPVTVTSGVRCPEHNARVGGAANSRHLKGKAMDFIVAGIPGKRVLKYVQSLPGVRYAYAINGSAIHMDVA